MPSRITLRRASVLLATSALTVSGLAFTSAPASAVPDPGPVADAADWLRGELTDNLIVGSFGPDIGLTIDAALGLDAVDPTDPTVEDISNAIETSDGGVNLDNYVSGDAFGDPDSTYAGAVSKALVMAQTAGSDPTTFGTHDLVDEVRSVVSQDPGIVGRIEDVSMWGDFANVLGQSFAVRGLTGIAEAEDELADATNFLLKQQCGAGYFRLSFTEAKDTTRQRCVDGAADSAPDTDATALTMINLLLATGSTDPDVEDAVAAAAEWLVDVQRADGSFGGGTSTEAPNTNSTGLAAWALNLTGQTTPAARAASWVRGRQAVNVGACMPWEADTGAIAYNQSALNNGQSAGMIEPSEADQWRRATAQALPGLALTPAATSDIVATAPAGFRQGGRDARVAVTGVAPGAAVCASLRAQRVLGAANSTGNASLVVTLPRGTATRTVSVSDGTTSDTAQYDVLGSLRVPFTLKPSVARGKQQVVQVSGLEPGEAVRVFFRGRRVDIGVANGQGRFNASFPVTGKAGRAEIEVLGQFPIRHASKTFVVTA